MIRLQGWNEALINKKFVAKIVIGIFCLTWLMWGGIVIANQFGYVKYGTPLSMVMFIIGAIAPAVVPIAFILKDKIMPPNQLFRSIFAIKQPFTLYLLVLGFMALFVITGIISGLFTPFLLFTYLCFLY